MTSTAEFWVLAIIAVAAVTCAYRLGRIQEALDRLAPKPEPVVVNDADLQRIIDDGGSLIDAIKAIRNARGCALKDAKDCVDKAIEEGRLILRK